MKFIRYIARDGGQRTGTVEPDGTIRLIDGSILDSYEFTGQSESVDVVEQYLVPVDIPNIIALGLNYIDHANESKMEVPERPLVFVKTTNSLTAHQTPIVLPEEAPSEVDFEAELGVIIGKTAKRIVPEEVSDYIFGYTCVNDVSARDCQLRIDKQWARGKSFDTFCPTGPTIETDLDTAGLRVRLWVNGECMQDGSTRDMIFSVADTISFLSRSMTLLPGTLVMTGTPPGVGFARKPPVYLKPGDNVVVDIEGLDKLENNVVPERP